MILQSIGLTITPQGHPTPIKWQASELGSNISSTESDVNINIEKVWSTIDRLMTM